MKRQVKKLLFAILFFTFSCTEKADPLDLLNPVILETTDVTAESATLNARLDGAYSGSSEFVVGFDLSQNAEFSNKTTKEYVAEYGSDGKNFSCAADGLKAETVYYVRAFVYIKDFKYSEAATFTTEAAAGGENTGGDDSGENTGGDDSGENTGGDDSGENTGGDDSGENTGGDDTGGSSSEIAGWLELPAATETYPNTYTGTFYAGSDRNYSYLYDKDTYTSYWVAYPLYAATQGGSRNSSWDESWNPYIDQSDQVPTWLGGYGVDYGSDYYSRGHQIPDADRSGNSTMQRQTYYATNMTPQLQNSFNGGVWANLETKVRSLSTATDTLYTVTGAILQKQGSSETVQYINPSRAPEMSVPVPNYYYKVLLKVTRSGDTITGASAIGFWMPHFVSYSSSGWSDCVVSVDEIEDYTGFDFFVNLPEELQKTAEAVSTLSAFESF